MHLFFNKQASLHFKNRFLLFATLISLAIITISPYSHALAANEQLKFRSISTSEGLSQSYVFDITQDEQGFLWFATEDGLNRYDGHHFIHYRHDASDVHSIADNVINKVFIDNKNILWVATERGLSRYNIELDNFTNYHHQENDKKSLLDNYIFSLYQDNQQILWVATKLGLHRYNHTDDNFTRVRIRGFEDQLQQIQNIYQDNNNNYWIATSYNGLFIINEKFSYAISLQESNKWDLIIDATTIFNIKSIEGNYWLATNNGLYIISADYKLKQHITTETNNRLLSNQITDIEKVNDTHVWIATSNGLNTLNLLDNSIQKYQSNSYKNSLSDNWLLDIYQDDSGKVWLGTYSGLNQYNLLSTNFQQINSFTINKNSSAKILVTSFAETSNKDIWFTTQSGKLYKRSTTDSIQEVIVPIPNTISQVLADKQNNLWLLTSDNALYQYNQQQLFKQNNWTHEGADAFPNLILVNDQIWYINAKGILKSYHLTEQQFQQFSFNNLGEKIELTALGVEQKNQQENTQVTSKNASNLWLTTESGQLLMFNLHSHKFTPIKVAFPSTFSAEKSTSITVSKNWIWLGSQSQGLTLINRESLEAKTLNETNQLKNNFIASILIDENENAWLSTNKGITMVESKNQKATNFDSDFDIVDSEFIYNSALNATNNLMFFGSNNGFYFFDPLAIIQIKQKLYPPIFTDVFIANNKIPIAKKNILQTVALSESENENENNIKTQSITLAKQINYLNLLTLSHNQSPFSIEFTSPNAKLPSQVGYRYRLIGLEKHWIEAGKANHRATYTNLTPGNYNFEVQAYDHYNPTLTKGTQLSIRIMPPWWLSTSAKLIYALISVLLIAYVFQQMRHKRQYHLQIKLSEERLKLSLWGSGDEMWDWNIETGKIFRSNIWGVLEFPQDGTRNVGAEKTNLHQHDIPRVRQALSDHFDKKTDHFAATYRVKDRNDRWIWVLDRGKVVERDEQNRPKRMTGTLKDISQIKKAEERLKLFAKCIENISDAVVIYDRQFITVDVNKAFQRITGKNKNQMLGSSLKFSQYPETFCQNVKKHLITNGSWHGEIESNRHNGELYLTDLNIDAIRDDGQNITHFVGVFSDITKRKETEAELRKLANTDTLTGLPNRSYFQANQARLVKNKIAHALLVFDLDNFKKINDSLGHQVGDILLCKVAQRMLKVGRKQDAVYRLGGDEFSIIIEDTNDIHTITTLAKKILQTIAIPLKLRNQEIVLYSSIGIVLYPEDGASPAELLKNADTAMYHAKDLGGNKYQFFSESMNKQAVKRLQVEGLIRHGLKEDLFSVYYQPKIEIATGKIAGMEALVRFETPKKGLISPVIFIPVSEETGQIIDIGEVVLRKACFATKKWVESGLFDGRIAVNLSAVQFTQPNLVTLIANILAESKLPAKYLELEITEGTVMDSPQQAIETMLKIRSMGIHLALDDFGTGYSSLAYLKKFPLNTLKIDKAFVDDIEHSEQGRNMVATIVTIAHNLDMHVVAEGVETEQQLSFLSGLRCEQLQGYLYSKPLAEKDFQKYLLAHQITDQSTSFSQR